jgi:cytochrome c-type biogenesis protein CcmH/NrfG
VVSLEVGDDLHLLFDEVEAGEQAGLEDPEPGQQQEHEDHRAVAARLMTALRQNPCQARRS